MIERNSFTIKQFNRLLDALKTGGYAFAHFSDDRQHDRVIFLRHDIDKDIEKAALIARIEHERGISATYFFLLRSRMYNPLDPETAKTIRDIAGMGHRIGLHCDESRMDSGSPGNHGNSIDGAVEKNISLFERIIERRIDRVVSFHNPTQRVVMRKPATKNYVSTYGPDFMMPHTKYLSDSNAHWREGDPGDLISDGVWPRIHLLIHPIWWAWDAPVNVAEVLLRTYKKRCQQIDTYLIRSNDLWRTQCNKDCPSETVWSSRNQG